MSVLSDSILVVALPSGGAAVYSVPPSVANRPNTPHDTLAERARMYGKQLAHWQQGRWFEPGGWVEIFDLRRIALLERATEA